MAGAGVRRGQRDARAAEVLRPARRLARPPRTCTSAAPCAGAPSAARWPSRTPTPRSCATSTASPTCSSSSAAGPTRATSRCGSRGGFATRTRAVSALPRRPLGASGLEVSVFALGSWRTYERISREEGVAVLQAARAAGIDFLEVARYNDESGTAPIPTGYSEVVFGEVFRGVGLAARRGHDRHQAVVGVLARADGRAGARGLAGAHRPRALRLRLLRPAAARAADGRGGERGRRARRRAAGCAPGASSTGRPSGSPRPGGSARELGVAAPCAAQLPYSLGARWLGRGGRR